MHVIFPSRSPHQQPDDHVRIDVRAAEEQAFYECHGADEIVGFFRCIEALSALGTLPAQVGRLARGWLERVHTAFRPVSRPRTPAR